MTTVTWAQLTPDERALLDKLARALLAGDEWVQTPETLDGISQGEYGELLDTHKFIEWNPLNTRFKWLGERITPTGLLVWQQGQATSAPRSVWVAMWCYNGYSVSRLLNPHETLEGAKKECEEDAGAIFEWSLSSDGTHYFANNWGYIVAQKPVLP